MKKGFEHNTGDSGFPSEEVENDSSEDTINDDVDQNSSAAQSGEYSEEDSSESTDPNVDQQWKTIISSVAGREMTWRNIVLLGQSENVEYRLSHRSSTFEHLSYVPKLAINGMIHKIQNIFTMPDFVAFINTLKEEIHNSGLDNGNEDENALSAILAVLSEPGEQDNVENEKQEVIDIYRKYMMISSCFPDGQYEGRVLAEQLQIHLTINSHNSATGNAYTLNFGPAEAENIPRIVLVHTQGNRGSHFVLDEVNGQKIPHCVYGDGDCLFRSFAQAILELYIQNTNCETPNTLSIRRRQQTLYGIKLDLLPRALLVDRLKDNYDLTRQHTAESFLELDEDLNQTEIDTLCELVKYDVYHTVRVAAAETLICKCNNALHGMAKDAIFTALLFPSFGYPHQEGADLVRSRAAIALFNTKNIIEITETEINTLVDLFNNDAFITVRIAVAKVLFFILNEENRVELTQFMLGCLTVAPSEVINEYSAARIRETAIRVLPDLNIYTDELMQLLKQLINDPDKGVQSAAIEALQSLGGLKTAWSIATDNRTGSTYCTNGYVMLAAQFHPYECWKESAFHQKLLTYAYDSRTQNYIQFIQKCIAAGTRKFPISHSVKFQQLLGYSLRRYYGLPLDSEQETFISLLFSLPGTVMPTLTLYDRLLADFVSPQPKGLWSSIQNGYIHFNDMMKRHGQLKDEFERNEDSVQTVVIDEILNHMIVCLYAALHAFRDHELLEEANFTEDEIQFMDLIKIEDEAQESFRSCYLGESETDLFHVRKTQHDESRTVHSLSQIKTHQMASQMVRFHRGKKTSFTSFQEEYLQQFDEIIRNNKRYTKPESAISFLLALRDVLNGTNKNRQLLGVALGGTLFKANTSLYSNENTIYLSFTEQFRVIGSVFLEFMGRRLSRTLSEHFHATVHVRIPSSLDIEQRLIGDYTVKKVWGLIIDNPASVSALIINKMEILIGDELSAFLELDDRKLQHKKTYQYMAAFIDLEEDAMISELGAILTHLDDGHSISMLSHQRLTILGRFGEYVLNNKVYSCVEMQLIPLIKSGCLFPIILNPIDSQNALVSFEIPKKYRRTGKDYSFSVAKPCERFCQYANTAYDIQAEIANHFSDIRTSSNVNFPAWQKNNAVIQCTTDEALIVEEIISQIDSVLEERYQTYEECYQNQFKMTDEGTVEGTESTEMDAVQDEEECSDQNDSEPKVSLKLRAHGSDGTWLLLNPPGKHNDLVNVNELPPGYIKSTLSSSFWSDEEEDSNEAESSEEESSDSDCADKATSKFWGAEMN